MHKTTAEPQRQHKRTMDRAPGPFGKKSGFLPYELPEETITPSNEKGEGMPSGVPGVSTLVPNQKLAVAIEPNGQPGNRITILSPLFDKLSPAIQSLRSNRFKGHWGVVMDGPMQWIVSIMSVLQALDKEKPHTTPEALFRDVHDLVNKKGLQIEYVQRPE